MSRYFFDIFDGEMRTDDTGHEFADIKTAKREAVRFAGAVLRDEPEALRDDQDWQIILRDETGLILSRLMVVTIDAPVLKAADSNLVQSACA